MTGFDVFLVINLTNFTDLICFHQSLSMSSSLHIREVMQKKELQVIQAEVEALLQGPVPESLRESARQVNVPVVRGDLALQLARQDYYKQKQDQVHFLTFPLYFPLCFQFSPLSSTVVLLTRCVTIFFVKRHRLTYCTWLRSLS